jgi:hypothetical protein
MAVERSHFSRGSDDFTFEVRSTGFEGCSSNSEGSAGGTNDRGELCTVCADFLRVLCVDRAALLDGLMKVGLRNRERRQFYAMNILLETKGSDLTLLKARACARCCKILASVSSLKCRAGDARAVQSSAPVALCGFLNVVC